MAGKLTRAFNVRRGAAWVALAAAVIVPMTFAGTAVFGTFTIDLDRRDSLADLNYRKALVRDLDSPVLQKPHALLAAPLFVVSRMPFKAETPAAPGSVPVVVEAPPAVPSYRVGGVMIMPQSRKVLLRSGDNAAGQWLSEGDVTAQGWTVSSIEGNQVALARGAQRSAFDLYMSR